MALQWRQPQNALKAAKTLSEMLITLALSYASPLNFSLTKRIFSFLLHEYN